MDDYNIILKGTPVSSGVKVGRVLLYQEEKPQVTKQYVQPGEECIQKEKFDEARSRVGKELDQLIVTLEQEDSNKAKIFLTHREILENKEMLEAVTEAIMKDGKYAEYAVWEVFNQFSKLLEQAKDSMIAARVADVCDVKNRLLCVLQNIEHHNLSHLQEDVIIVARDLLPSDTVTMDRRHVIGIITETGGSTSHSAIIARCYRIPAVLGVQNATGRLCNGMMVIINGITGDIVANPDPLTMEKNRQMEAEYTKRILLEDAYLAKPGRMKDDTRIEIGVNISGNNLEQIPFNSYDYIGLFRSEFLYMESAHLPTEEEQFTVYKSVLSNSGGKTVTLRTLDIGGDKTLPYMELPKETNPFLGMRALRVCLTNKNLFRTQLRAVLRASSYGNLQIMFPMVGSIEDILQAKDELESVKEQLRSEKVPFNEQIKTGIMIEIPSIALIADLVAREVDFACVGTNDLTQYLCAADRMNTEVSRYYQPMSPAMLRCLSNLTDAFQRQKKPLSVCGEMAGNPEAALILAGLGIHKLSMSEANIAPVKAALAGMTQNMAKEMANTCKNLRTQAEVLDYIREYRNERMKS